LKDGTLQEEPASEERVSRRKRARQIVAARLEKLEDLSIGRLVPSTLTLLGLCSGATAVRFALEQDFKGAMAAVVFAAVFDMLDGRAARLLGADSRFGAQLDSLADLVSFGIAPAVIMYVWSRSGMGDAGWVAALIFCACSAIRLARFNVQAARDEGATTAHPYFTGLPTPAAACLMLFPLLISFQWPPGSELAMMVREPVVVGVTIAVTSALMVSKLPTPSIKYMRMQRQHRILAGLAFAGVGGALIAWPWATLTIGLLIYVGSIPLAILLSHPRHETKPVA